jgi:hypothetical protein
MLQRFSNRCQDQSWNIHQETLFSGGSVLRIVTSWRCESVGGTKSQYGSVQNETINASYKITSDIQENVTEDKYSCISISIYSLVYHKIGADVSKLCENSSSNTVAVQASLYRTNAGRVLCTERDRLIIFLDYPLLVRTWALHLLIKRKVLFHFCQRVFFEWQDVGQK